MSAETFVIASRYSGPPGFGNGGYVCGTLAAHVPGAARVRLKAPIPLETPLRIEASATSARLLLHEQVIAEAWPAELDMTPPSPPAFAEAQDAAKNYAGFKRHSFPRCFVCGPLRSAGDGLRIFPGPLAAPGQVAAPWIPDPSLARGSGEVGREFLWSALDCTSAFPLMPLPEGKAMLLGELCGRVDGAVAPRERCVAVGWKIAADGRKRIGGSAVYSADGRLVAAARATWIEVDAKAFGGS